MGYTGYCGVYYRDMNVVAAAAFWRRFEARRTINSDSVCWGSIHSSNTFIANKSITSALCLERARVKDKDDIIHMQLSPLF